MKIAVIGTGIAGLTSARSLHVQGHEVHVFEKQDRIGGHTNTVLVEEEGRDIPVDTGFIVFNDWTYPEFISLMNELKVPSRESEMSFSVRDDAADIEYNGTSINTLFAQRRNLFRPSFLKMISDILKFNKEALAHQPSVQDDETLGGFLADRGYSEFFQRNYILPMVSAIWSSGIKSVRNFPLKTFITFFKNHGMLSVDERPVWRTIVGGSKAYLPKIIEGFADKIRTNARIESIKRVDGKIEVLEANAGLLVFDAVVLACHSDEALSLLKDADRNETEILGAIPYEKNVAVLHTDEKILPKRRLAWAAWNYAMTGREDESAVLTYNMNILQGIKSKTQYLVTLNAEEKIDPAKVIKTIVYHHPVYTTASDAARRRHFEINGKRNTFFAGAYWRYGFHEDGVHSAIHALKSFNKGVN